MLCGSLSGVAFGSGETRLTDPPFDGLRIGLGGDLIRMRRVRNKTRLLPDVAIEVGGHSGEEDAVKLGSASVANPIFGNLVRPRIAQGKSGPTLSTNGITGLNSRGNCSHQDDTRLF